MPRCLSEEYCDLQGTDNVQGQVCKHILKVKWKLDVFIILQIFFETCTISKIGEYSQVFHSLSWGICGHLTLLDLLHASKHI